MGYRSPKLIAGASVVITTGVFSFALRFSGLSYTEFLKLVQFVSDLGYLAGFALVIWGTVEDRRLRTSGSGRSSTR